MGEFKDKHGKSRVGMFLQKLGEKAAPLAEIGLNVASDLTGIKALDQLADKIKGSDQLEEHEKQMALELLKLDKQEIEEVTKRWQADMSSDSVLSKNVRPATLIFLMVLFTVMVIGDGTGWLDIADIWATIIQTLMGIVFVAYFGSRGMEKITQMRKK